MKRAYQITAVLCIVFSALVAQEAMNLRLTTRLGPGPGFFPFWLAVAFGLLAVLMLIRSELLAPESSAEDTPQQDRRSGQIRIGLALAVLLITARFIDTLGFCLTMFGFCLALIIIIGERRWHVIFPSAILGSFGVYFIFVHYLGVSLPAGLLSI